MFSFFSEVVACNLWHRAGKCPWYWHTSTAPSSSYPALLPVFRLASLAVSAIEFEWCYGNTALLEQIRHSVFSHNHSAFVLSWSQLCIISSSYFFIVCSRSEIHSDVDHVQKRIRLILCNILNPLLFFLDSRYASIEMEIRPSN